MLEGTIYDPAVAGGTVKGTWPSFTSTLGNPLYNVVVYVPNTAPSALSHGQPSCASCSSLYTGDSIVATTTDEPSSSPVLRADLMLDRTEANQDDMI